METYNSIELTKQLVKDGKISQEIAETIFPELKESEDERIRKAFIKVYQGYCPTDKWNKEFTFGQIVAWIERLGDKAFSVERLFAEAGIGPAYKDGDSWCVLIGENIQEGICGFGETPRHAYVNFLKELWEKAFEQKPVEWSDKDEKMLNDAIGAIGAADYYTYDDKQEIKNWLELLKERHTWKPSDEQIKALENSTGAAEEQSKSLYSLLSDLKKLKEH